MGLHFTFVTIRTIGRDSAPPWIGIIRNIHMPPLTLKLTKVGTSTGTILPKEMLTRLKVEKGDCLYAIETPEGYLITPYGPAIEEQLKLGRDIMREQRDAFKALAK